MASGLIRSQPNTPRLLHGPLVRPHLTLPAPRQPLEQLALLYVPPACPLLVLGCLLVTLPGVPFEPLPPESPRGSFPHFFRSPLKCHVETPSPQLFSLKSTQLPSCSVIPYLYLPFFLSYGDLFSPWLYSLLAILYLLPIVLPRTHAP